MPNKKINEIWIEFESATRDYVRCSLSKNCRGDIDSSWYPYLDSLDVKHKEIDKRITYITKRVTKLTNDELTSNYLSDAKKFELDLLKEPFHESAHIGPLKSNSSGYRNSKRGPKLFK